MQRYGGDPQARGDTQTDRPARVVPSPADAPGDHASLHEVERWLRPRLTESAYGFDPVTGRKVWERHTDGLEVPLEPADRERLRGMIFTHNHPRGRNYPEDDPRRVGASFSPDDVYSAALTSLAELRAVTPAFILSMKPGSFGWPTAQLIEPLVDIAHERYWRGATLAATRGTMSPVQASVDELHAIWTELAPLLGVVYMRTVGEV